MDEQEDLEEAQEKIPREVIEEKLKEAKERLARYEAYQKLMEETGAFQMPLTDAYVRLMKNKNGFAVAYNLQIAVDSETRLIRNFEMTNQVTDHGMLSPTMEEIRKETLGEILEVVADQGYENAEDMVRCGRDRPHVIMDDGKGEDDLEIPFEEAEPDTASTEPKELKKILHAGKIPEAYKEVILDMRIEEVHRIVKEDVEEAEKTESVYGMPEKMSERAKERYFVRDPERNLVHCPAGKILRQKCIKKNGNIRYVNKNACRHCKTRNKCYKGKGEWKEIDFTKDTLDFFWTSGRDWLWELKLP